MEHQPHENAVTVDAQVDAEAIEDTEMKANAGAKMEAAVLPQNTQKMIHTRSCNRRKVCSCYLRLQSACFQKNLVTKRRKKQKSEDDSEEKMADDSAATAGALVASEADGDESALATPSKKKRGTGNRRTHRVVTNLQRFEIEVKQMISIFLKPAELAKLSMCADRRSVVAVAVKVSHTMRSEVETIAEIGTREFVSAPSRTELVLKDAKQQSESWARYLHVQMNCVHRLLVYYTGYKTGQMRSDFAHWTFGLVEIDPNDPSQVVLPNTWKFREHEPWMRKRANGKDGEWLLRPAYKRGRAPKAFVQQVKEWAGSLRPGAFVAVARLSGAGVLALTFVGDWILDPSVVLDAKNDKIMEVHPDDLLEHFTVPTSQTYLLKQA